jgi:branched-chain amino acid transport system ATP-binding protein
VTLTGTVPVLELRGVRAEYDGIEVVHGVDLEVPSGAVMAVLGPNGAGKSTMLRVVAGLHAASAGGIYMAGRCVTGARADQLARRGVCLIPEGRGVFPNLTVLENLRMVTYAGVALEEIEAATYTRFPRLGQRRSQLAGNLSGGEQQMLALARALATSPALLLLDELSMGLAPTIVTHLYDIVAEIAREGVSILVVEQFANMVLRVADQAAIMVHGQVVASGSPDVIRAELAHAYLGG